MISVVIPSYNREQSITAAVRSVLEQTYKDIEVIIVDDGSSDDTCRLVEELEDDRVRLIRQDHGGACAARNRGIDAAQGEYIAFHDSDDLCHPDRLEHQLNVLEKYNADFVCGNVLTHQEGRTFISPNYDSGWINMIDKLFNITTMTFMGKAEVFRKYKFDPKMPRWQDLDLLLSLFDNVKIYFTDYVLCDYFREGDSLSLNPQRCIEAFELMIDKYPFISNNGGVLYSRLLKMYADSKIAVGRRDYYKDYKATFMNNKSFVNLVWLVFAKFGYADWLYGWLHGRKKKLRGV